MEQTVREVAAEYGVDLALTWADHRTECLESEIRRLRQSVRALAGSIIAKDLRAEALAQSALKMLASDR